MDIEKKMFEQQQALLRAHQKCRYMQWYCVVLMVILSGSIGFYVYFNLEIFTSITPEIIVSFVLWVTILFILTCMISILEQKLTLEQRLIKIEHWEIDLVDAVEHGLEAVIKKHLPTYRQHTTKLSLGEDIVRDVSLISQRSAQFQTQVALLYPHMKMAEAIDAIIAESSKRYNVETNVTSLIEFMEKKDRSRIVRREPLAPDFFVAFL